MSENTPWTTSKIADLGRSDEVVQTGPFGAQLHAEDYTKEGIPLILIRNIKESGLDESSIPKISPADADRLSKYSLIPGDIVFSRVGRVGSCFLAEERHRGWIISGQTLRTRTDPSKVYPGFLFYALQQDSVREYISGASVGTTRTSINTSILENIQIELPPLPEQKKIAEILSAIDERTKLGEQKISQLEILLLSAGARFFKSDSRQEMKTIGEIFEVSSGSTPSRSRQDYFCSNGGTPWVKTMDLNDAIVTTTDEQITDTAIHEGRARVFPRGTLLLAMYGGWNQIGRTGILGQDASCNQAMSALLPSAEILPEFLNLQLVIRRSYWKSVAASSRKDPNITKSDVQNMRIIAPPIEKQQEIKDILESIIDSIKKERSYISSLKLLKSSLSSELLSGRKRVSV